ncbi:MAG: hypothetical protein ACJ75J_11410, partial [Cytophagaceae bacterium]
MIKKVQVLICLFLITVGYKASSQVLDSASLSAQKYYTSIDEAFKEPLKVYKLSLENSGGLPVNIDTLKNLQVLNLHGNDWDDALTELPERIGNLKYLQFIYVSNSNLYELPESIGNLKNLKGISCLTLKTLPATIGQAGNLRSIEIYGGKTLPESLSGLTNLKELTINKSEKIPVIPSLEKLVIEDKTIFAILDPSLFTRLREIKFLQHTYGDPELSADSMEMLVTRLSKFPQLKSLDLIVSTEKAWKTVLTMKNLTTLSARDTIPVAITRLQKLSTISFCADSLNCERISRLPGLWEIQTNCITPHISRLKEIRKITFLEYSSFNEIPWEWLVDSLSTLPCLEEINARFINISSLPEGFKNLKQLKSVDFSRSDYLFYGGSGSDAVEVL